MRNSELTQIVEGIDDGNPIVVSGGYAIPDMTAIEIEKSGTEKDPDKPGAASTTKDKE